MGDYLILAARMIPAYGCSVVIRVYNAPLSFPGSRSRGRWCAKIAKAAEAYNSWGMTFAEKGGP